MAGEGFCLRSQPLTRFANCIRSSQTTLSPQRGERVIAASSPTRLRGFAITLPSLAPDSAPLSMTARDRLGLTTNRSGRGTACGLKFEPEWGVRGGEGSVVAGRLGQSPRSLFPGAADQGEALQERLNEGQRPEIEHAIRGGHTEPRHGSSGNGETKGWIRRDARSRCRDIVGARSRARNGGDG